MLDYIDAVMATIPALYLIFTGPNYLNFKFLPRVCGAFFITVVPFSIQIPIVHPVRINQNIVRPTLQPERLLMAQDYHHGVRVVEVNEGTHPLPR